MTSVFVPTSVSNVVTTTNGHEPTVLDREGFGLWQPVVDRIHTAIDHCKVRLRSMVAGCILSSELWKSSTPDPAGQQRAQAEEFFT